MASGEGRREPSSATFILQQAPLLNITLCRKMTETVPKWTTAVLGHSDKHKLSLA